MSDTILDQDLVKLDGICSPHTQLMVDKAKKRLLLRAAGIDQKLVLLISNIREHLQEYLKFKVNKIKLSSCLLCDKKSSYEKYTRSSRNHRKGTPNYDKPIYFDGVEVNGTACTIRGYSSTGCCVDCWNKNKDVILENIKDIKCENPVDGKYRRINIYRCECSWEGSEYELVNGTNLVFETSKNTCPKCGTKLGLFSSKIKLVKYDLVDTESK